MELHAAGGLGSFYCRIAAGLRFEDGISVGTSLDLLQDLDDVNLLALLNDLLVRVCLSLHGLLASALLLFLSHLPLGHNLLCVSGECGALQTGKEAMRLLGLRLTLGQRVELELPFHQLALEQVQELLLMLLEIPAHGYADHLLARDVLDALLELLFDRRGTIEERQVADTCSVVLVGRVGHVHLLEETQLTDAEEHASQYCKDVGGHAEVDLGPHEALLRLETPCHQNAVLSGRLGTPGAQDQQRIVDGQRQEQPAHCDGQGPDDEEELEIEVERHTHTGHVLLHEIGVQGPELTALVGLSRLWHADLGTRAVVQSSLQAIGIDDGARADVNHPVVAVLVVAGALGIEGKSALTACAGVRAVGHALRAAVDDAGTADAHLRIWDRLELVDSRACLRGGLHALEVAVGVVTTVIGINGALLRASQELVRIGVHHLLLVALRRCRTLGLQPELWGPAARRAAGLGDKSCLTLWRCHTSGSEHEQSAREQNLHCSESRECRSC
mmetsp:Transcript_68715/g.161052  ORF Transcript_68715/g.161052 Transcript_68715/m.161052 type:complete len:501 (-) Transcript_68715:24-1526(-)